MKHKPPGYSSDKDKPSVGYLDRYRILQEVKEVGSVIEVCRRAGITRQTYYHWKKRYLAAGLMGLEDRPTPPSPGRPKKLTDALAQTLLAHVKKYPREGCIPLSKRISSLGVPVSSPTIQKALIQFGLGSQNSRQAWVRAECPFIDPTQTGPNTRNPTPAAYGCAKSYFFNGIPKGPRRQIEILQPSVEEVAIELGVEIPRLKAVAEQENWFDARARLLNHNKAVEFQELKNKVAATLDITSLSFASLSLQQVRKAILTSDSPSPRLISKWTTIVKQSYRILKKVFGGKLPTFAGSQFQDYNLHLNSFQIVLTNLPMNNKEHPEFIFQHAKKAFFLGIPFSERHKSNPNPSILQVAEFIIVPVRLLQQIAVKQKWVKTRREADHWNWDYRQAALVNQVGIQTIHKLVMHFNTTAADLMNLTIQILEPQIELSGLDLSRLARSLDLSFNLFNETTKDLHKMSDLEAP